MSNQRNWMKQLLAVLWMGLSLTASATHLIGGNLGYTYLGETAPGSQLYRYQVYMEFYMNCGDDSNWQTLQELLATNNGVMPVGVYAQDPLAPNANKALLTTVGLALVDSALIVPDLPNGCSVGAGLCTKRGLLRGFVNLPLNFGGYHLYFQMNARNLSISNLLNPNNTGIGYYAFIPPPLLVNSSPIWLGIPTPLLCINDTSTFVNSATDPDGDQLIFSFEVPYNSVDGGGGIIPPPNTLPNAVPLVNYVPAFSVSEPFGPGGYAFINGATGLTAYMPTVQGNYVVAVEVKEYRNGVLIGRTRRDLQLQAVVCPPNDAPEALAGQGTAYMVLAGQELCFDLGFTDPDADSLLLVASGTIFDGALFSPPATIIAPVTGNAAVNSTFCWDTDCDQAQDQPYLFSVSVSDNGCPPRTLDVIYQITVLGFSGPQSINGPAQACTQQTGSVYSTAAIPGASFTWTVTGGQITSGQGSNSIIVDWGAAGPGSVQVSATNAQGCASDPISIPVNVVALPATSAGADAAICPGASITLGGSPTGPGGSSYSWSPAIGLSSSSIANPTASPAITTQYIVQVTNSGCVNRDTVVVTVNQPQVDAGNNAAFCIGGGAQLSANGNGGGFSWSPATGLSSTTISNPIAAPTVTTTYTVTLTDAIGCTITDSVTVTVNQLPDADAGADLTPCESTTIALGGAPTGPVGSTFSWLPATGLDDATSPNPALMVTTDATYIVVVTDANQCINADTVIVAVLPLPDVDAGPDLQVCFGGSVQLQGSGSGALLWTPPFGLNDPTVPDPICTPEATTVYTLTVTDSNTCTNSDQALVTVNVLPSANAGPDEAVCLGGSVTIGTNQPGSYSWSPATGLSATDVAQPSASPVVTTTYYVALTDATNCSETDSVVVTVNQFSQSIAIEPPVGSACENAPASAFALPDQSGNSYAWSTSGPLMITGAVDNTVDLLHTTPGTSTLYLIVTDANDCSSDTISSPFITLDTPDADAGPDVLYCIGDSVLIGGAPTGPVGSTITWSSPSGSISDNSIGNPYISAAFTEQVIVFVSQGSCADSDTLQVAVSIPAADAGPDASICEGSSTQLIASGGASYSWSPTTDLSDPDTADPIASPATTTTYVVSVTNDDQCTAVDSVQVVVNAVANAGLDGSINTCGSGSVFTLTDSLGGTPDTMGQWFTSVFGPHVDLFDPSTDQGGTYYYVAGIGTACPDTAALQVSVTNPEVDITGDDIICIGETTTLTASGGTSYNWSPTTGVADPNGASTQFDPIVSTDYVVTVTDAMGCVGLGLVTIEVNPLPATDAGSDLGICIGSNSPIGGSPTGPPGATYAWVPASSLSSSTSANPTATPSATTTYTVTVTDGNQCVNTDDVVVTVNLSPTLDAGADVGVCLGSSVQLGASGSGTFSWSPSTGLSSTTDANPIASPTATTTYTVTLTDGNSCTATDDVIVTVNPLPTVDAGEDAWLCQGFQTDLNGSGSAGAAAWTPAANVANASALVTTADPLVTTTFTLTITDANNCAASDAVIITVSTDPPIDAGSDATVCGGVPVQLGGSPTSVPGSTFLWSPASGLDDPTSSNPTAAPNVTTTYILTVSNDTCSSTQAVTVTIGTTGVADFTARFEPGCENLRGFFLDQSAGAVAWQWDLGNGTTSTSENTQAYLPYGDATTVTLVITDISGCTDTTSQVFTMDTYANLANVELPNVFTPNGDGQNDVFTLTSDAFLGPCSTMDVMNRWGESIFLSQGNNITWDGRNFAGEPCTAGTYFYVVKVGDLTFKGTVMLVR
ncbi:MAG: gliding motility-associated C-terminal domain-containing protein [Flavobacteriales bacterium]|nr:gliding motility-associated C-terminal domain-containing protein [Flavobacteriales bacterium]